MKNKVWITSFWTRVFALFIDSLLLGAIGYGLGLAFENQFSEFGPWGRLVGFVIALIYFGLLNSTIGKGQTLGKRLFHIRVVDASGAYISVPKSFVRYTIFAIPFLFNGAQFTSNAYLTYLIYPLSIIVFGGLLSIIYLYIFNRVTRQSLHDLVVGSYVVNTESPIQKVNPIWKTHLVITASIFVGAAGLPAFTSSFSESAPFKELLATQQDLLELPEVGFATVTSGQTTFSSTDSETKKVAYLSAHIFVDEQLIGDAELARKLALIVADNFPDSQSRSAVQIVLTYGFDIGIWSQWSSRNHSFQPEELEQAISQKLTKKAVDA